MGFRLGARFDRRTVGSTGLPSLPNGKINFAQLTLGLFGHPVSSAQGLNAS